MILQRQTVTFEASLEIEVFAPLDATQKQLDEIYRKTAEEIRRGYSWDTPEFEAIPGRLREVEIEDDELLVSKPNHYGYRAPNYRSVMCRDDAMVLSDDGSDVVLPSDATWWITGEEE